MANYRWLRGLAWSLFGLALVGLGWGIDAWPAMPRLTVREPHGLLHVAPDGKTIATSTFHGVGDRSNKIWDTFTGRELATWFSDVEFWFPEGNSPDGRFQARLIGGNARELAIADRIAGRETRTPMPVRTENWPEFSPASRFVVVTEQAVVGQEIGPIKLHLVESASGKLVSTLRAYGLSTGAFTFTPDDELLVYYAEGDKTPVLTVWSTRLRQASRTLPNSADITGGVFAPDGRTLLINRGGDGAFLLDLTTGQTRALPAFPFRHVVVHPQFSPDSRSLVCLVGQQVDLWDVSAGRKRMTMKCDHDGANIVGFWISPDSRHLVFADMHGLVGWDLETGRRLWERRGPSRANGIDGQAFPSRRILFDPKSPPGCVAVLDPATGIPRAILIVGKMHTISDVKVTPDGRSMVASFSLPEQPPGLMATWLGKWWPSPKGELHGFVVADVPTGQEQIRLHLRENTDGGLMARWWLSDDGRTLVTMHNEPDDVQVIHCWDVPARSRLGWAIGIPLGLAMTAALWRWRKRLTIARPAVVSER